MIVAVCLSVCLFVRGIFRRVSDGFEAKKYVEWYADLGHWTGADLNVDAGATLHLHNIERYFRH